MIIYYINRIHTSLYGRRPSLSVLIYHRSVSRVSASQIPNQDTRCAGRDGAGANWPTYVTLEISRDTEFDRNLTDMRTE